MRKNILIAAISSFLTMVVTLLLVPHGTPQVALAGGTPSGNGDVNGDGGIDIGDAVYVLSYLFAHGPVPEPIVSPACDSCCPPCPPSGLPATGQTTCYDTNGSVIDCASTDYPGQDGFYQKGCPTANRFVDNQDGTVTDACTGLMWQKETAPGTYTWQDALKYCESLTLAGQSDWRLPNVRELQSSFNFGYPEPFPPLLSWGGHYWSSSTYTAMPKYAFFVDFSYGTQGAFDKINGGTYNVRAVRDAR